MNRLPRVLLPLCFGLIGFTLGCSGQNAYQAAKVAETAVPATTVPTTDLRGTPVTGIAGNQFIPEDQNISSCVGTNERPNCGSKSKGGYHLYLVFAALFGGVGFIGWRVARGVKARDAVVNNV